MTTFRPSRLVLARKRRGLTISALAEKVGLSTRRLGAFENSEATPPESTVATLALALDFPRAFFSRPDIELPTTESASFRALSNMTAAQRDAALSAGALAMELSSWIEGRFRLPAVDLPDHRGESPEAAAEAVRAAWGLGDRPIPNVLQLLEAHGVRSFSLVERCLEVDAFSLWRGDVPFVFLNTMKSSERARFDAAHELGHLVLHRHGGPQGREAETEADQFASAFLMPRTGVLARTTRLTNVASILQMKKLWKVSAMAIAQRLRGVGLLSEWHHRQLCIEMSQRGFRSQEPDGIAREMSQVLNKVFAMLRDDGITKADTARELALHATELDGLVFGLAVIGMDGARVGGPSTSTSTSKLRLVHAGNDPRESPASLRAKSSQIDEHQLDLPPVIAPRGHGKLNEQLDLIPHLRPRSGGQNEG